MMTEEPRNIYERKNPAHKWVNGYEELPRLEKLYGYDKYVVAKENPNELVYDRISFDHFISIYNQKCRDVEMAEIRVDCLKKEVLKIPAWIRKLFGFNGYHI